jgi:hypothetical protein
MTRERGIAFGGTAQQQTGGPPGERAPAPLRVSPIVNSRFGAS